MKGAAQGENSPDPRLIGKALIGVLRQLLGKTDQAEAPYALSANANAADAGPAGRASSGPAGRATTADQTALAGSGEGDDLSNDQPDAMDVTEQSLQPASEFDKKIDPYLREAGDLAMGHYVSGIGAAVETGKAGIAAVEGKWDEAGAHMHKAAEHGVNVVGGKFKKGRKVVDAITDGKRIDSKIKLPKESSITKPLPKADFDKLPDNGVVDPNRIKTMQNSIKPDFKDDRSIEEMIDGLKSGKLKPEDIKPVKITEINGETYTLDHRRLVAHRLAGVPVRYEKATAKELRKAFRDGKMSGKTNGHSIIVKQRSE